jgi:methionyl-tRNA formyltransferase
MKTMSKAILFFGNERLATGVHTTAPVLQALVAAGYHVAAVIIAQEDAGASRSSRELEISSIAERLNIPVLSPPSLKLAQDELATFNATAGVLVAYGKIVPTAVIHSFPRGIINIHPSLLPRHRGPTPLESALLAGEHKTGVSLMQLAAKMDAGPIYAQEIVTLMGNETKQELADQLAETGKSMLLANLPGILDGSLIPKAQDDSLATYDARITKSQGALGVLDWKQPAETLTRRIRAYHGWPRTRTTIGAVEVIITEAHSIAGTGAPGSLYLENKQLGIHTGDGILIIDSLIPAGKRAMSGTAFLTGYTPQKK